MVVFVLDVIFFFVFSSRRRHTRCALVTEFRRVLFRSEETSVACRDQQLVGGLRVRREGQLVAFLELELAPLVRRDMAALGADPAEIGRASCRERVCQYV